MPVVVVLDLGGSENLQHNYEYITNKYVSLVASGAYDHLVTRRIVPDNGKSEPGFRLSHGCRHGAAVAGQGQRRQGRRQAGLRFRDIPGGGPCEGSGAGPAARPASPAAAGTRTPLWASWPALRPRPRAPGSAPGSVSWRRGSRCLGAAGGRHRSPPARAARRARAAVVGQLAQVQGREVVQQAAQQAPVTVLEEVAQVGAEGLAVAQRV